MITFEKKTKEIRSLKDAEEHYRRQGFTIEENPPVGTDFSPDFIARRGEEVVVVEVSATGKSLPDREADALQLIIQQHPSWRVDVVFVESESNEAGGDSQDVIRRGIAEAVSLFDAGHKAAALMQIWSAIENPAIKHLKAIDSQERASNLISNWPKLLAFHGLIDEPTYHELIRIRDVRNRVSHGQLGLPIEKRDFDTIKNVAEHLLAAPMPETSS